jgi:hypothetical protein
MPEEHSKPVRLATVAYHAALAGKWESAARAIKRISDECGGDAIVTALIAWCDAYVDHATDGRMDVAKATMNYINSDSGRLDGEDSDRLPERVRWAGRLVKARASMDEEEFRAALDAVPEDEGEWGSYVLAVLECVATTINGLPRGFGRMGRGAQ